MANEQKSSSYSFLIYTDAVKTKAKSYDDIAYNQARSGIVGLSSSIDVLSNYKNSKASEIRATYDRIIKAHDKCRALCDAASQIAGEYESAESDILSMDRPEIPVIGKKISVSQVGNGGYESYTGQVNDKNISVTPIIGPIAPKSGESTEKKEDGPEVKTETKGEYWNRRTTTTTIEDGVSQTTYETKVGFKPSAFKYKEGGGTSYIYDKTNKKWVDEDTPEGEALKEHTSKIGTIAGYSIGVSAQHEVATLHDDLDREYAKGSYDLYALRASAHAGAGAGVYLYKTKNGHYVVGEGVYAEAGASFTLAGFEGDIDVGGVALGAGLAGEIQVGTVEAEAKAQIGMVGSKFVANIEGEVGAYAFSAEGTVKGRLLGIEASASGSFRVGVGASAKVGFDGGKFDFKLGASLGIGFEINFSFDATKVVDGVKSAISAVGSGLKKVGSVAKSALKTVGKALTSW